MTNKQITKQIIIITIGVIIIFGCLAMSNMYINDLVKGPRGPRDFSEWTEYEIDPETILEKLRRGDKDLFTQVLATPENYEKSYLGPFPWKQSDYLKIASALHQYTGNDAFTDWHVYSMLFSGDCQYDPVGFDLFNIVYIKDVEAKKYNAREIDIYPLYKGVRVSEEADLQRPMFGLNGIKLDKIKVTADNALQIAEENGGRNARLTIKNQCRISILSSGQDWHVRYSSQDPSFISSIFEMNIDSSTGKYKIITTK
jgi:hypothetical protein